MQSQGLPIQPPRRVKNSCADGGSSGVFCLSVQLVNSGPRSRHGSRSDRGAHFQAYRQAPPGCISGPDLRRPVLAPPGGKDIRPAAP